MTPPTIATRKKIINNINTDNRIYINSCVVNRFSLYSKLYKNEVVYLPTILIKDLKITDDKNVEITIDHVWIKPNDVILQYDLKLGMVISFTAKSHKYKKTKYELTDYGLISVDDFKIKTTPVNGQTLSDFLTDVSTKQNKSLHLTYEFWLQQIKSNHNLKV